MSGEELGKKKVIFIAKPNFLSLLNLLMNKIKENSYTASYLRSKHNKPSYTAKVQAWEGFCHGEHIIIYTSISSCWSPNIHYSG